MRSFVGLAGVYRRFVPSSAGICLPLLDLIEVTTGVRATVGGQWGETRGSGRYAKRSYASRPALGLSEQGNYNYLVRTDTSDFAIGATPRQIQKDEKGAPIERILAYFS